MKARGGRGEGGVGGKSSSEKRTVTFTVQLFLWVTHDEQANK